jgi:hypothetical protein
MCVFMCPFKPELTVTVTYMTVLMNDVLLEYVSFFQRERLEGYTPMSINTAIESP